MDSFSIHPDTTVGPVDLAVADLARSERFYHEVIGLKPLARDNGTLILTADGATPLLQLHEQPGAHPRPRRSTGLYHFAILTPSRLALARSLRNLAETRWPLTGASDHLVSEALYLDDPDGNGIEIYRDRAREEWPRQGGQIQMAVDPLDVDGVLAELEHDDRPWDGLEPATTIGHVHLHVADLRAAKAFYCDVLGFELMVSYGHSALFVSAGGYHHHLGLNVWAGVGAPPPPPEAAGLRYYVVELPNQEALEQVVARVREAGIAAEQTGEGVFMRDPSQNGVVLRARRG
ncbi:MAG TPA: VOC family protein [Roseiflexaceae bacterium]|nr:VOC family protein [Roseiflexaceae bacterium]